MKLNTIIAAGTLLSVITFAANAATAINTRQAQNRQPIGTVSVSAVDASPMDLHDALNHKADAAGASAYRVIEAHEGNNWHVTAELYK